MRKPKLVEQVHIEVLRKLTAGHWSAGARLPPSRLLARQMGVSHVTLQAALRAAAAEGLLEVRLRRPVVVLPEAAAKAKDLLAALASRSQVRRLAILFPERAMPVQGNAYYNSVVEHVTKEGARRNVEVSVVAWPLLNPTGFPQALSAQGFSAALALSPFPEYLASLYELTHQSFPVLVYNRHIPWLELPSVRLDEYRAAWRLGEMLAQHGHRNMCLVTTVTDERMMAGVGRVRGWYDFLRSAHLIDGCTAPVYHLPRSEDVGDFLGTPFGFPGGPTAAVFYSDNIAEMFLRRDRFDKIKVPEEMSMAAFDPVPNVPVTPWRPQLTTFQTDLQRTAECALEMVEQMLRGNLNPPSVRVPMNLKLTASIGPAPAAD